MDKPQIIVYSEKSLNYSAFDVKWMPKSAKVVTIGSHPKGTGAIQVYELTDGKLELFKDIQRPKAIKCATFGASRFEDRHLATGDFVGNLELIDLNKPEIPVYSVKAHSEMINTIDGVGGVNIGKGAPEIVTGSRDGHIKLWDPRKKDSSVLAIEPESPEEKRDCWTVCLGNSHSTEDRTICAGFDNGDIKLFDLRSMGLRWQTNVNNGVCNLEFDRKDIEMNKLVAATLESRIHIFDLRTQDKEENYASLAHKGDKPTTLWCCKHLPQNRDLFVTTNGNGCLDLYNYVYPSKRVKKHDDGSVEGVMGELQSVQSTVISSQPVVGFDWNRDKTGLSACVSLDQTLRVVIVTKLNTL